METHPVRVLIFDVKSPPERFLERLFYGLSDFIECYIGFETSPPKGLPENIKGFIAPSWQHTPIFKFSFLCARISACLVFYPKTTIKILSALRQNGILCLYQVYIVLPYIPYLSKGVDWLYFPWNSTSVKFRTLLKMGYSSLISCRGAQINVAAHNPRRRQFYEDAIQSLRLASHIHCVSSHIKTNLEQQDKIPANISVIRPAVNTEKFNISPFKQPFDPKAISSTNPFRIVSVGSLIWRKGFGFLVDAVLQLHQQHSNVSLQILGEGPERERLQHTIREFHLEQVVSLPGKVSERNVLEALHASHLFVSASWSEGISNAVLEAMAVGLPVISTDVGGMRELIQHRQNGLLVSPGDCSGLCSKIKSIAESESLYNKLVKSGRTTVEKNFQLNRQVEEFLQIFQKKKSV